MNKIVQNILGLLLLGVAIAFGGSLLHPVQAAAANDRDACLNDGVQAFNLVVYVKIIDGNDVKYSEDFTFSVSSFQHRANPGLWSDRKHNTIREQLNNTIKAEGPTEHTFRAKLNNGGNPAYGNGNLCNPQDGTVGKKLAYAFRQGDGTYTAGGTIFDGTPKNNTTLRNQPKISQNEMMQRYGYDAQDNNGSWLLSCIGDDVGFKVTAVSANDDWLRDRTGKFDEKVTSITPENFAGGGNDLNHDNIRLRLVYRLDPQRAKVQPFATARPAKILKGSTATISNWVEVSNTKRDNEGSFSMNVDSAKLPGGNFGRGGIDLKEDRLVPNGAPGSPPSQYTFTGSQLGTYCRTTRVSGAPSYVNVTSSQATACVEVVEDIVADEKTVIVRPNVTATSSSIEVGEKAFFDGKVEVSNFPTAADWGYTEKAIVAQPIRAESYKVQDGLQTEYRNGGSEVRYKCATDSSWGQWRPTGSGGRPNCKDRYACPSGSTVAGDPWAFNPPACNGWRCAYQSNFTPRTSAPTDCEARCENGAGDEAARDALPPYKRGGDLRCYQQPRFVLNCTFEGGPSSQVMIEKNGTYSCGTAERNSNLIGQLICATLSPSAGSWQEPAPGKRSDGPSDTWKIKIDPLEDDDCTKVVGKSYIKVYNGDARTGGGVGQVARYGGADGCETVGNAALKAKAKGLNIGAGAQGGAFATGSISNFLSGQYKAGGNSIDFANTGSNGYFESSPACTGFWEEISNYQDTNGSRTLTPMPFVTKNTKSIRHDGDLFISGNITYAPWLQLSDVPKFQVVVKGNIYISGSVTQLDGLYAAVKDGASGGNIYTCAISIGTVPTTSWDGCKRQLVVNGALAANKLFAYRDCGSLKYNEDNGAAERTVYTGGANDQRCTPGVNAAAEIVNYTPEQWIRTDTELGEGYDSISSLPPVL